MDLRLRHDDRRPAAINHPDIDVRLIEKSDIFLVEPADAQQMLAPRGKIRARQAEQTFVAQREIRGVLVNTRVAVAIDERIFALEAVSRGIANEPADGNDVGIRIRRHDEIEPVGLGNGVVVDEDDDVPLGVSDSGVARRGDVSNRVDEGTNEIRMFPDDLLRAVDRRPVDDDRFEVVVSQLPEALQRPIERVRSVDGHDDDGRRQSFFHVVFRKPLVSRAGGYAAPHAVDG